METFRGPICHVFVLAYLNAEWKKKCYLLTYVQKCSPLREKKAEQIRQDIFLKEVKVKKRKTGEKGILNT